MTITTSEALALSQAAIRTHQLDRLNKLLLAIRDRPFYSPRLKSVRLPLDTLDQLSSLPVLCKADLISRNRRLGNIFELPPRDYVRCLDGFLVRALHRLLDRQ